MYKKIPQFNYNRYTYILYNTLSMYTANPFILLIFLNKNNTRIPFNSYTLVHPHLNIYYSNINGKKTKNKLNNCLYILNNVSLVCLLLQILKIILEI